jgi:5'-phosphate synthase pdxT subunit
LKIGIVAVQGAVSEHTDAVDGALKNLGARGEHVIVRRPEQAREVDALIIPGGESTTIAKLLDKFEIRNTVITRAREGMPALGTCAGCILLAEEGDLEVDKTGTKLLGLMHMAVDRNAFGRQRESFEAMLRVEGFEDPFEAVFIRAPAITRTWNDCKPLSSFQGKIVMARQENLIATAFHPELTGDTRVHETLINMV